MNPPLCNWTSCTSNQPILATHQCLRCQAKWCGACAPTNNMCAACGHGILEIELTLYNIHDETIDHRTVGISRVANNNLGGAIEAFRAQLKHDQDKPNALNNLGTTFFRMASTCNDDGSARSMYSEALKNCQASVDEGAQNSELQCALSNIVLINDQYERRYRTKREDVDAGQYPSIEDKKKSNHSSHSHETYAPTIMWMQRLYNCGLCGSSICDIVCEDCAQEYCSHEHKEIDRERHAICCETLYLLQQSHALLSRQQRQSFSTIWDVIEEPFADPATKNKEQVHEDTVDIEVNLSVYPNFTIALRHDHIRFILHNYMLVMNGQDVIPLEEFNVEVFNSNKVEALFLEIEKDPRIIEITKNSLTYPNYEWTVNLSSYVNSEQEGYQMLEQTTGQLYLLLCVVETVDRQMCVILTDSTWPNKQADLLIFPLQDWCEVLFGFVGWSGEIMTDGATVAPLNAMKLTVLNQLENEKQQDIFNTTLSNVIVLSRKDQNNYNTDDVGDSDDGIGGSDDGIGGSDDGIGGSDNNNYIGGSDHVGERFKFTPQSAFESLPRPSKTFLQTLASMNVNAQLPPTVETKTAPTDEDRRRWEKDRSQIRLQMHLASDDDNEDNEDNLPEEPEKLESGCTLDDLLNLKKQLGGGSIAMAMSRHQKVKENIKKNIGDAIVPYNTKPYVERKRYKQMDPNEKFSLILVEEARLSVECHEKALQYVSINRSELFLNDISSLLDKLESNKQKTQCLRMYQKKGGLKTITRKVHPSRIKKLLLNNVLATDLAINDKEINKRDEFISCWNKTMEEALKIKRINYEKEQIEFGIYWGLSDLVDAKHTEWDETEVFGPARAAALKNLKKTFVAEQQLELKTKLETYEHKNGLKKINLKGKKKNKGDLYQQMMKKLKKLIKEKWGT